MSLRGSLGGGVGQARPRVGAVGADVNGLLIWGICVWQVLILCVLDAVYYIPCLLVLLQGPAQPVLVSG